MPGPRAPLGAGIAGPCTDLAEATTLTSPGLVIVASPQITSTLFFLRRKPTPAASWADTPRERFTTAVTSGVMVPFRVRPKSLACWELCSTSAERSNAFVGMQPQLRQ